MTEFGDPIPQSYEHWRHCIEHWCGIEMSPEFIEARIGALDNPDDEHTQRFIDCYGESHRQAVLGWLKQARQALGEA